MQQPEPPDNTRNINHLREFLADRDEECPLCGYNLRGLTGDHCPECGKKLVLRVGLEEPVLAAYIIGVVGLAALFGFAALTLFWFVAMSIVETGGPPGELWLLVILQTLVSAMLLGAWVGAGSRIRRLSRPLRVTLAFFCCLAPIVGVILFTLVILWSF